ncbi:ABC transporter substrate-binding protein [Caballeronia sp. 15711]|uniref:ABC transporter substrate-binding protein n=1 Tax=Caballeronia sp. 15711 TaxID=3391029 RepID=UPI0039E30548
MKRELMMGIIVTIIGLLGGTPSLSIAQKNGGTLHAVLRDNPPSASIQEETTSSTLVPFMPVFNNLVVFDQLARVSEPANIKPDLADSWRWTDGGKRLTFELHAGVKWHDGVPFTSADVKCTWDTIRGVRDAGWRKNPRKPWYSNLEDVVTDGDLSVTFVLKRPQPSFLSFLASGFSPVYPCHVDGQTMRSHPIGTGPFKLAEYRRNQIVRLVRNPDYFKKGKPYLDEIDYRLIANSGTRLLAFVSQRTDITYPDINPDDEKNIRLQQPAAICDLAPAFNVGQLIYNPSDVTLRNPQLRKAIALAIDRKSLATVVSKGRAAATGVMMVPPEGAWGLSGEQIKSAPGFAPDVEANRREAQALMKQLGYGSDRHLSLSMMVVNRTGHITPATLLADQLRRIYIDVTLDPVDISVWTQRETRRADYQLKMWSSAPALDDPDAILLEQLSCRSSRNYSDYCDPVTQAMIEKQSATTDPQRRKELVNSIDLRVAEQGARPVLYTSYTGFCRYPFVHGAIRATNSLYNTYRYEDVWLGR